MTSRSTKFLLAFSALFSAWAVSAQVASNVPAPFERKSNPDIQNACALALTNIRSDLAGLSATFPILDGMAATQITNREDSGHFAFQFLFLKNVHAITNVLPPESEADQAARQFPIVPLGPPVAMINAQTNAPTRFPPQAVTRMVGPGGIDVEVVIKDTHAKFQIPGNPTAIWLPATNGVRRDAVIVGYSVEPSGGDSTLVEAVKSVIFAQTAILKTNLLNLVGAGAAP